jgi:uncharacterized protein YecA (UPF0149 family)
VRVAVDGIATDDQPGDLVRPPARGETDRHHAPAGRADPPSVSARVAPGGAGRNEPCPCGSGLKYKKCCGRGVH